MNNQIGKYMTLAVIAANIALACGCSSTSSSTGTGGSGGAGTGTGGATAAGTGGAGGAPAAAYPDACVGVSNKAVCDMATAKPCVNTCGPNKSGYKNCDCVSGLWSCPVCAYAPGAELSCYKIKASTAICPADPTDTSGMGLPASGGTCTLAACTPCGSASANAYRDSGGIPKVGYCVCVPNPDATMPAKYSCTSLKEYPPTALLPQ